MTKSKHCTSSTGQSCVHKKTVAGKLKRIASSPGRRSDHQEMRIVLKIMLSGKIEKSIRSQTTFMDRSAASGTDATSQTLLYSVCRKKGDSHAPARYIERMAL